MSYDNGKTITFDASSLDPAGDIPPAPAPIGGKDIPLNGTLYGKPTEVFDPLQHGQGSSQSDSDHTIFEPDEGEEWPEGQIPMNCCVGWLLAVSGPNKGRSYELHACRNLIGRGEDCGIRVMADNAISRNQVVVVYDSVANEYAVYADRGTAITRLNGRRLTSGEVILKMGDVIELSPRTTLMFVPACGDKFQWC